MDFRLLRRIGHFLAVAEEGHFGRAAARLGLSQPPLTAQIQALEAELGLRLLERTRKGARPTREGEALLPLARRLARDAGTLEALARALREGRGAPVAIACVTSGLFDHLPPLVRALREALPDSAIAVPQLRLDRDRPPLCVRPLGEDHLVAALPEGHALLQQPGALPLAALAGAPLLTLPRSISPAYFDGLVAACRAAGFEPRGVREVGSAMAQLGFVASGLGIALVSSGMARIHPPGVVFRAVQGPGGAPVQAVAVALAWNAERPSEASAAALAVAQRVFPPAATLPSS